MGTLEIAEGPEEVDLMVKMLATIAAALLLAACAPAPTKQEDIVAYRGPAPSNEEAEAAIRVLLSRSLRDPDSLKQLAIKGAPTPITWYQGLLAGNRYEEAWMVCFEYNAKNAYGGYVGLKVDRVAIRNGQIVNANWVLISAGC